MKMRILLLSTLLFASCGKDSSSGISAHNNQFISETNEGQDSVLLAPKFYNLSAFKFFHKKEILQSDDKRYVDIQVKYTEESVWNNIAHSKGVKEILIKGKKIILSPSHQQGLFEQLHNMTDIKSVTIEAESIDISKELKIPSASIFISARDINFSSSGQFNITPLGFSNKATRPAHGKDGVSAGEIVLNIDSIHYDEARTGPILILNGGEGQDGALGEHGDHGNKLRDLGGGAVYIEKIIEHCEHIDTPRFGRFDKATHCSTRLEKSGAKSWPRDGQDAIAGTRPGTGGRGGIITSNVKLKDSLISSLGGLSGHRGGEYNGGRAGEPVTAIHKKLFIDRNGRQSLREQTKRVSVKGRDVVSPAASKVRGESGKINVVNDSKSWAREGYLEKELLYANDLFVNNHIEKARESFLKINHAIKELSSEEKTVKTISIESGLSKSLMKINSQRDFYGNSVNWVPNFSLEANFSKYKTDLEYSLKTLYFTYWIKNSQKSLESKVSALESIQEGLLENIERYKESYNGLISKVPFLKEKISDFKVYENYFLSEVKRVENEISAMARNNVIDRHKVPFLRKALSSVAAISTAIPAGQPALGLIGTSLDVLTSTFDRNSSINDIIRNSETIYDNFNSLKIDESSDDWNKKWSEVKLSRVKEITNKDELKKYLSSVINFSEPIIKGVKEQAVLWRDKEVPSSEIALEIEKIKSTHSIFKSLTKNLEKYMTLKKALIDEVNSIQIEISNVLNSINSNFDKISDMSIEKSNLLNGSDSNLASLLDRMEQQAKSRLLRYHYEMARAYEYRLLRPYRRNINLDSVISKIQRIVHADSKGFLSSSDFDSLKGLFTDELSWIVENTLTELNREGLPLQREKVLKLNENEVELLNNGEDIYLDLISKEVFSSEMEDIRINNIVIENLESKSSSSIGQSAEISLEVAYSGESFIKKGGKYFFFKKNLNEDKVAWGATLDLISGETSTIESSPSAESLIRSIIGEGSDESLMLLSRPGGLTQLKVKLRKSSFPKVNLNLRGARFRIIYDYNTF